MRITFVVPKHLYEHVKNTWGNVSDKKIKIFSHGERVPNDFNFLVIDYLGSYWDIDSLKEALAAKPYTIIGNIENFVFDGTGVILTKEIVDRLNLEIDETFFDRVDIKKFSDLLLSLGLDHDKLCRDDADIFGIYVNWGSYHFNINGKIETLYNIYNEFKRIRLRRRNISELKGIHNGQDVWIIGGGPSLNYIDPSFFDNKITIGCNESFVKFKHCTYFMRKDGAGNSIGRDILKHIKNVSPESKLVVSEHYGCAWEWPKNVWDVDFDYWYFNHFPTHGELTMNVIDNMDGGLIAAIGIMGMAVHFSVFLGFKNIILCGNDNVFLDGKDYMDNYVDEYFGPTTHSHVLKIAEEQTIEVVNHFRSKGYNIYSLNPFINLSLEGHKYSK